MMQTNILDDVQDGDDNTTHVIDERDQAGELEEKATCDGDGMPSVNPPTSVAEELPAPAITPALMDQGWDDAENDIVEAQCTEDGDCCKYEKNDGFSGRGNVHFRHPPYRVVPWLAWPIRPA